MKVELRVTHEAKCGGSLLGLSFKCTEKGEKIFILNRLDEKVRVKEVGDDGEVYFVSFRSEDESFIAYTLTVMSIINNIDIYSLGLDLLLIDNSHVSSLFFHCNYDFKESELKVSNIKQTDNYQIAIEKCENKLKDLFSFCKASGILKDCFLDSILGVLNTVFKEA